MNNLSLSSEPITQFHRENKAQETPTISTKKTWEKKGKRCILHNQFLFFFLLVRVTADGLMRCCNVALFAFLFCFQGTTRLGFGDRNLGRKCFLFFLLYLTRDGPLLLLKDAISRLITEQKKKVSRRQGIGGRGRGWASDDHTLSLSKRGV